MTTIAAEIDRFNRLAETWWNSVGPMRPLHVINRLRLAYILEQIAAHFASAGGSTLEGLHILDVGCGAGLMCEPFARRGAQVTGIDAAEGNIAAARFHAAGHGVAVDYRVGDPAAALGTDERFDAVLLLEVVEHVSDAGLFVTAAGRHVAPGGVLVISTIDRTWKSFGLAIVAAEYLFRLLPTGTHAWRRFVRPSELESAANRAGFALVDLRGMRYLPVLYRAWWARDTSVNYIATFARSDSSRASMRQTESLHSGHVGRAD